MFCLKELQCFKINSVKEKLQWKTFKNSLKRNHIINPLMKPFIYSSWFILLWRTFKETIMENLKGSSKESP